MMIANKKPRTAWQPIRGIKYKALYDYYSPDASNGQEPSQEARITASGLGYPLPGRLRDDRHAVCFTGNGGKYHVFGL